MIRGEGEGENRNFVRRHFWLAPNVKNSVEHFDTFFIIREGQLLVDVAYCIERFQMEEPRYPQDAVVNEGEL